MHWNSTEEVCPSYTKMVYEERVRAFYKPDFCNYFEPQHGPDETHNSAQHSPSTEFLKGDKFRSNVNNAKSGSKAASLLTACCNKNLAAVKSLIENGADVNYKYHGVNVFGFKHSNVALISVAAALNSPDLVNLLVQTGADVNHQVSPEEHTVLHTAILAKSVEVVAALGKYPELDVRIPCISGQYPIHLAIISPAILEMVLKFKNVDINAREATDGLTPLHVATFDRRNASVKILIQNGADVNAETVSGHTALDLALQRGHFKCTEMLTRAGGVSRKSLNTSRSNRWLPWNCAIAEGPVEVKRKILNGFGSVNHPILGGATALHHMVLQDQVEGCKFLLMKGANVNAQDHFGYRPLHFAAAVANVEIMEVLLYHGAEIDAVTFRGETALLFAVKTGSYSAAKFLIKKGADLYIGRGSNADLLCCAVFLRYPVVAKLLLDHGMNPNDSQSENEGFISSVFVTATMSNQPDMIRILADAGADVNCHFISKKGTMHPLQLLACANRAKIDTVRALFDVGSFIDAKAAIFNPLDNKSYLTSYFDDLENEAADFYKNTNHLFKAVRKNDIEAAEKFYKKGATVNCCSIKFYTPLVYAAWKGYLSMVRFLLDRGARVNDSCPLMYAAKCNHEEIVVELLRRGADVKKRQSGRTAFDVAREANNVRIAWILKVVDRWLTRCGP